jgi:two-component system, NtrC family, sensor histidine kinase HydH
MNRASGSKRAPAAGPPPSFVVDLHELPVAALATREGVFVAQNPLFEELTGWKAADVLGKTMPELLHKLVAPRDRAVLERLSKNRVSAEPRKHGRLWCRVMTASGEELPMRVEWRLSGNGRDSIVCLLDAKPEAFGQEVTEALARVAGALSRCATEDEVLERAVDALAERGFIATVLLIDEDDPLLRYGASRNPARTEHRPVGLPRPRKELLTQLNPAFMDRRTAFFLDGMRLVREAYAEPVAEQILASLPADRMVQAPLFVGNTPYGALVVTGDALSPLVATALDLFAELVGKALETVRLRRERVERERLAALGEAAGVMAHEVRNPVGSIMNALALLRRDARSSPADEALLAIISEEAARLEHLVAQLLDLGRPLLPRPCEYSMEELARRAVRVLTTRGELANRSLEMPATEGTLGWMDPDLAELALVNVVRNAVQSTALGAKVRIRVETNDACVRWVVEDQGPGIPESISKRLGQPFVTTRAAGTGMGLAVVGRILEASGGQLVVERSALGGAQVILELPRPRAEASST